MRICIITNIPSPYRVDFFNYLISNSLHDILIIYSSPNEYNRKWNIDKNKIKNSIFLKSKTIKIRNKYDNKYIHVPFNIINKLNQLNPDIVIGSEYNPTVLCAFIWCKLKMRKFISWSDGTLNSEKNINKIQYYLRKIICSNADSLIASSTETKKAQIYYGAEKEKVFVSLLTIDVDTYLSNKTAIKDNTIPRILYVGSLIKRKGVDLLLNALVNVKGKYVLDIVGDGDEKENLVKQVENLGIIDKVNFVGYLQQDRLTKVYDQSDIFILPTREDCFGLVLLEAMCRGLQVISSKYADGAADIINDGVNGTIIDPYNANDFADKITICINNCNDYKRNTGDINRILDKFKFTNVSVGFIEAIKQAI